MRKIVEGEQDLLFCAPQDALVKYFQVSRLGEISKISGPMVKMFWPQWASVRLDAYRLMQSMPAFCPIFLETFTT
jgi:hypothetical protein